MRVALVDRDGWNEVAVWDSPQGVSYRGQEVGVGGVVYTVVAISSPPPNTVSSADGLPVDVVITLERVPEPDLERWLPKEGETDGW